MEGLPWASDSRIDERATEQTKSELSRWHAFCLSHADYIFQGWWQQTGVLLRTMVGAPACDQPVLLTIAA
jgi:hypothetical protein